MEITVQYTGQLAEITGTREEAIELSPGALFKELVGHLSARHGKKYADLILTSSGDLRLSTLIIVDGEQQLGDSSEMVLDESRTVMLMTPIAGG
jgi:molybdopterin converting factor small subunit